MTAAKRTAALAIPVQKTRGDAMSPELDETFRATMRGRTPEGDLAYEQLSRGIPRPAGVPVPAAQFPAIKTPARERWSGPGPGQPDPHRPAKPGAGPLRWAYCPDQGRLHLLAPAEVVAAATAGHADARCGRTLPAQRLTLTHGSSGAVCMACMDGIPSGSSGPRGTP